MKHHEDTYQYWIRAAATLAMLIGLLATSGCGSQSGVDSPEQALNSTQAPALANVEQSLSLENIPTQQYHATGTGEAYESLLRDMQRQLKAALEESQPGERGASGAFLEENTVFSLAAELITDDGPAFVDLSWTDNLRGDYNGNGIVEISDLVPLAANIGAQVAYAEGSTPGDPQRRPAGNFSDNPVNWRLARIDGDSNGLISVADLATLARHYGEHLDGYRVYRQLPGEDAVMLEWPRAPEAPLSISQKDGAYPGLGIYHFADRQPVKGEASYFVTTYIVADDQEGSPSNLATLFYNTAPHALFSIDDNMGSVPQKISFDATASTDDENSIVLYEWDLDGDGQLELSGPTLVQVSRYYDYSADIQVSLRVTDEQGSVDWLSQPLLIGEPPVAVLQANKSSGQAPLAVVFTFADSYSPQSLNLHSQFEISSTNGYYSSVDVTDSAYLELLLQAGYYTAKLTVTDELGGIAIDNRIVQVTAAPVDPAEKNLQPSAAITVDRIYADPGSPLDFSAAGSSDPDGFITSYLWSVDNPFSNEVDEDFANTAPEFSYAFETGGTKVVYLTVTDNLGATDTTSVVLDITPKPVIVWNKAQPLELFQDDLVDLSASASYALVGGLLDYAWYTDEPVFELVSNSNYLTTRFKEAGEHFITLRVTDALGQVSEGQFSIIVIERPIARVQIDQQYGQPGRSVTIDASQSSSVHGEIVEYRWEYDKFQQQNPNLVTTDPVLTIDFPGTQMLKDMRLTVVDDQGNLSRKLPVDLYFGWHDYSLDHSFPNHDSHSWYNLDGNGLLNETGSELHLYLESEVGFGSILFRKLSWNGSVQASDPYVVNADSLIAGAGDVGGVPYVLTRSAFPASNVVHFMLADDNSGHTWQETLELEFDNYYSSVCLANVNGKPAIYYVVNEGANWIVRLLLATDASGTAWDAPVDVLVSAEYMLNLCATDIGGLPALAMSLNQFGSYNLVYMRAQDVNGSSWNAVQLVATGTSPQKLVEIAGLPVILGGPGAGSAKISRLDLYRGQAVDGSSWQAAQNLIPAQYQIHGMSYSVINGKPAIALQLLKGNYYLRNALLLADDATGSSWGSLQLDQERLTNYTTVHGLGTLDGRAFTISVGRDPVDGWQNPLRIMLQDP